VSPDGDVGHTIVVGPDPGPVTTVAGGVWVALLGPGRLAEIDPSNDSIVAGVHIGALQVAGWAGAPVPCTLAVSKQTQTVWAPANGEGSSTSSGIWRIDALDHFVSGVIRAGGNPCGVSLGHGKVWVTNPANSEVDEIDPHSNHLVRRIALDSPPNAIASAPQHIWVVTD
jgi:DNA-binding beta-propeller fold protein YncE